MANRLKDEYWLYVVIVDIEPKLYIIQNPVENLKPSEEIEIVRYIIKDWEEKAEKVAQ